MRVGEVWKRQATRAGLIAALGALLLWPMHTAFERWLTPAFIAALLTMAASGVSILLITVNDMLTVRRSRHARAARVYDLALGACLALPPWLALPDLLF